MALVGTRVLRLILVAQSLSCRRVSTVSLEPENIVADSSSSAKASELQAAIKFEPTGSIRAGEVSTLSWSPDGQWLMTLERSEGTGRFSVYLRASDTLEVRGEPVPLGMELPMASWQRDSQRVAIVTRDNRLLRLGIEGKTSLEQVSIPNIEMFTRVSHSRTGDGLAAVGYTNEGHALLFFFDDCCDSPLQVVQVSDRAGGITVPWVGWAPTEDQFALILSQYDSDSPSMFKNDLLVLHKNAHKEFEPLHRFSLPSGHISIKSDHEGWSPAGNELAIPGRNQDGPFVVSVDILKKTAERYRVDHAAKPGGLVGLSWASWGELKASTSGMDTVILDQSNSVPVHRAPLICDDGDRDVELEGEGFVNFSDFPTTLAWHPTVPRLVVGSRGKLCLFKVDWRGEH